VNRQPGDLKVKLQNRKQLSEEIIFPIGLILLCSALLLGCQERAETTRFGQPIENRSTVAVSNIFDNPENFGGKLVILKGVIDLQDERGYWFYLVDGDYRIYVDLYTANFQIPDLTKRTVLAAGQIEVKMNIPSLLATGVELQ
jgi:hypothetical protein